MEFSVSIPLDPDGFLRRECPTCKREFKWFNGQAEGTPDDWQDPDTYFCPYCGVAAPGDAWFTPAQLAFAERVVLGHAGDLVQDELEDMAKSINRQGGLIRLDVSSDLSQAPPTPPLSEPNDMDTVVPHCHPFEPVKIVDGWSDPLHCLVCGAQFVVPD